MRVTAISDQHGFLPKIEPTDLLLIVGDICPATDHSPIFQAFWLDVNFRRWLKEVPAKKIIGIAGNHDFVWQDKPHLVPKDLPWTYLQDSGTEYEGLKIWGSPWQKPFFDWAFNLREEDLVEKWKLIPDDTDILMVHGPAFGYGDKAPRVGGKGYENTGSPSLLARIKEIKPKLFIAGHIHCDKGQWQLGETTIANVTVLNDRYELVYEPMIFDIPTLQPE